LVSLDPGISWTSNLFEQVVTKLYKCYNNTQAFFIFSNGSLAELTIDSELLHAKTNSITLTMHDKLIPNSYHISSIRARSRIQAALDLNPF